MPTPSGLSLCTALLALVVVADSSLMRGLRHPECGTFSGRVLRMPPEARSGLRITLRSGDVEVSGTTDRRGEFLLRVPGPGPLVLVAERDGVGRDSVAMEPLPLYAGYSASVEMRADSAHAVAVERVVTSTHSCMGPARDY